MSRPPLRPHFPPGRWTIEVLAPVQTHGFSHQRVRHDGGEFVLPLPPFVEDLAVKITAR